LKKLYIEEIVSSIPEGSDLPMAIEQAFKVGDNLRELDIHYPIKYQEMEDVGNFLRTNKSLLSLKLQKIKPLNFHFLSALSEN